MGNTNGIKSREQSKWTKADKGTEYAWKETKEKRLMSQSINRVIILQNYKMQINQRRNWISSGSMKMGTWNLAKKIMIVNSTSFCFKK